MAATEPARRGEFVKRRFVTRHDVDDAGAGGTLHLRARDVLTDEARTRARDLGVSIVVEGRTTGSPGGRVVPAGGVVPGGGSGKVTAPTEADLRRAVKAAVEAELGTDTPGLEAAIERVFARRKA